MVQEIFPSIFVLLNSMTHCSESGNMNLRRTGEAVRLKHVLVKQFSVIFGLNLTPFPIAMEKGERNTLESPLSSSEAQWGGDLGEG
jgi:hypothetical protein